MDKSKLTSQDFTPYRQAMAVLVLSILLMGFTFLMPDVPYSDSNKMGPWTIQCGMILFFAMANSLLSLLNEKIEHYWMQSIFSFAAILVFGGLLAWLFSGVTIGNAGSVKWLYMVFTFGYLVLLSISNLMKFLIQFTKNKDIQHLEK